MSKISYHIKLGKVPLHLYQIISGFILLARQGLIQLSFEKLGKGHPDILPYNMLEVIFNGQKRVLYDLNDGYDNLLNEGQNYVEFMDNLLEQYDLCFKRSFSRSYNLKLTHKHKMLPLGLNYMVTVPRNIAHLPTPLDPQKEKLKKIARLLPFSEYYNGLYYTHSFEDIPQKEDHPKVLFMCRLWEVDEMNASHITSAKKEERLNINEFRAKCIRLCQKELGDLFFGGVNQSKLAYEKYPDLVIRDKSITKRNNYLNRIKASSICIATMGLHESIGWKFAEYVAASKAIVTERLHYEVPANFTEGKNYLVFQTPEECLEKIYILMKDSGFRYQMMVNNYRYYQEYVRPDQLVMQSIIKTIETDLTSSIREFGGSI